MVTLKQTSCRGTGVALVVANLICKKENIIKTSKKNSGLERTRFHFSCVLDIKNQHFTKYLPLCFTKTFTTNMFKQTTFLVLNS